MAYLAEGGQGDINHPAATFIAFHRVDDVTVNVQIAHRASVSRSESAKGSHTRGNSRGTRTPGPRSLTDGPVLHSLTSVQLVAGRRTFVRGDGTVAYAVRSGLGLTI